MSGVGTERSQWEAPRTWAPRAALGPPKLEGPRSAAHSLEGEASLASLALCTPFGPHCVVPGPQGPLRAFMELVSADPALSPKAPKFPRNTSSPLGGGHPGCPQTKNPGHRDLPTPRGPGEPAASGRAVQPATAPRAPAALQGSQRRGSPEPASLQWDQSAKRDLPGQRRRRAESRLSPLES